MNPKNAWRALNIAESILMEGDMSLGIKTLDPKYILILLFTS